MTPCKTCISPYKDEIEKMLLDGLAPYYIDRWLKRTKEKCFWISFAAINRHKMRHMKNHLVTFKRMEVNKLNSKFSSIESCVE